MPLRIAYRRAYLVGDALCGSKGVHGFDVELAALPPFLPLVAEEPLPSLGIVVSD